MVDTRDTGVRSAAILIILKTPGESCMPKNKDSPENRGNLYKKTTS